MTGADPTIRIDYYTDPLCCWSWALEPVWRRIRERHDVEMRVVLGGMIESWETFRDPMNDVSRPVHLAPLWHEAGRTTGVPIDPGIWHVDPPSSSFPASVAVKAAALQSDEAGARYLSLAREAVMTRRLNIARAAVLCQLARELAIAIPSAFDPERFDADLGGEPAREAFRNDLARARFERIGRFPTIIVHGPAGSRMAVGYRPVDVMEKLIAAVADPSADRERTASAS